MNLYLAECEQDKVLLDVGGAVICSCRVLRYRSRRISRRKFPASEYVHTRISLTIKYRPPVSLWIAIKVFLVLRDKSFGIVLY